MKLFPRGIPTAVVVGVLAVFGLIDLRPGRMIYWWGCSSRLVALSDVVIAQSAGPIWRTTQVQEEPSIRADRKNHKLLESCDIP